MTRRKGRTWQPNEITSIIRSSQEEASTSELSSSFTSSSQESAGSIPGTRSRSDNEKSSEESQSSDADHKDGDPESAPVRSLSKDQDVIDVAVQTSAPDVAEGSTEVIQDVQENVKIDKSDEVAHSKRPKRPSIRLSMSQDGLAEVTLKSSTPSPEKSQLQRSVGRGSPDPVSTTTGASSQPAPSSISAIKPWPKTQTHGRSRDARNWEFYCDSDARNALTTAAQHEREGSALGALSLIRSNSAGCRPLVTSKKQNTNSTGDHSKRKDLTGLESKVPKLARTSSSFARLQKCDKSALAEKPKKGKDAFALWEDPDSDSDKENWEPGTRISRPTYRRFGDPSRATAVLCESGHALSHGSSLGVRIDRERARRPPQIKRALANDQVKDKENAPLDDDVAQFMGESRKGQKDDIDAVQSLLSLSKGAWR